MSMRLNLFDKLKYESSTIILFVGITYSMRYLLLTSITIPDPQTSDMLDALISQQVMTSQMRSHIEYLIQTSCILVLIS